LSGQAYAAVTYTRQENVEAPFLQPPPTDRQYVVLLLFDGTNWDIVADSYSIALDAFGPDALGPLGSDGPVAATAFVTAKVTPLPRTPFESGSMPDVLVLEMSYLFGPESILHPQPTLVLLIPTASGFAYGYIGAVGGWVTIDQLDRLDDSVFVSLPGYLPSDAACCPTGTEIWRLAWADGSFVVAEHCVRQSRARSCV